MGNTKERFEKKKSLIALNAVSRGTLRKKRTWTERSYPERKTPKRGIIREFIKSRE